MMDLLGMELNRAMDLLSSSGKTWQVRETSPPGGREIDGPFRVIRQEWEGSQTILTVTRVPDAFHNEQEKGDGFV